MPDQIAQAYRLSELERHVIMRGLTGVMNNGETLTGLEIRAITGLQQRLGVES